MIKNYNEEVVKSIRAFLLEKGLNEYAVAGLMGNFYAESGLRANNLQNSYSVKLGLTDEEYTERVDNGSYTDFVLDGAGYGLCQWTSSGRKQRLFNFHKEHNSSIGSLAMQLAFAWWELNNGYSSVLTELKNAKSVDEVTRVVMLKYERPADQSEAKQLERVEYGLEFYEKYAIKKEDNTTMSKKVFIGVGHGGSDPGAVKYLVEKDVNLITAIACREVLEANGVIVKMSRISDENDTLIEEIDECNAFDPDLAIDIHNNAGGGDGFEAFVSIEGGLGTTMGKNIEAEVIKLGQNSRGVKTRRNSNGRDYYGFIRLTKCPAVIVEGVFVDNTTDVLIADTVAEQREFGKAYARGILKTLSITEKEVQEDKVPEENTPEDSKTWYRVQVGAFGKKANAERLKNELQSKGYNVIIAEGV